MLMPVTKNISGPTGKTISDEADALLKKLGPISFEVEPGTIEEKNIYPKAQITEKVTEEPYMFPNISDPRTSQVVKTVEKPVKPAKVVKEISYKIQAGIFSSHKNASALLEKLKIEGFDAKIGKYGKYERVFLLASSVDQAKELENQLKEKGFEAILRRN